MADPSGKRDTVTICNDFLMFQDIIKTMRQIDDRVVHALNTSIPTNSFADKVDSTKQCHELFEKLMTAHKERDSFIKECIQLNSKNVEELKQKKTDNPNDIQMRINLKKAQTKLHFIEGELYVEEIVRQRSNKVFQERCRLYYNPPSEL